MIPQWLSLEGLYSYQAPVTIDFRPLTAARLFGIFGSVGSGKSTILEAMTLALYGESARLNRNDNRSSNLLNLRSDRLAVDFRFLNRDGDTYRFTVEIKRRRKNPEEAGTMSRSAYRLDAGSDEWVPLDHVDGERVLGLSYQNFRRTTIIPQGRFQEFLQSRSRRPHRDDAGTVPPGPLRSFAAYAYPPGVGEGGAPRRPERPGRTAGRSRRRHRTDWNGAGGGAGAPGRRSPRRWRAHPPRRERVLWTLERYAAARGRGRGARGRRPRPGGGRSPRRADRHPSPRVRDRVRGPWERRDDARRRETDAAGLAPGERRPAPGARGRRRQRP